MSLWLCLGHTTLHPFGSAGLAFPPAPPWSSVPLASLQSSGTASDAHRCELHFSLLIHLCLLPGTISFLVISHLHQLYLCLLVKPAKSPSLLLPLSTPPWAFVLAVFWVTAWLLLISSPPCLLPLSLPPSPLVYCPSSAPHPPPETLPSLSLSSVWTIIGRRKQFSGGGSYCNSYVLISSVLLSWCFGFPVCLSTCLCFLLVFVVSN